MRKTSSQRIAALLLIVAVFGTAQVGCGDSQANRQPASTAANADERPAMVLLVPVDTSALFNGIARIAEQSVPYRLMAIEGGTQEAQAQAVLAGKVGLAIMMRRPLANEPLAFMELFRTPVVILVSEKAGVAALTREQAAAIFSGQVRNWSEVGGADLPIELFIQEPEDTATVALADYLFDTGSFDPSAEILVKDKDIITVVGGLEGGIGYSSWAIKRLYGQLETGRLAQTISLDGFWPDDPNYPITGVVGFAYLPERQADLQPIFDWVLSFIDSEIGRALLAQYGTVLNGEDHSESEGMDDAHQD